jgi:CTP synthase (UTP-ammonia lyase)
MGEMDVITTSRKPEKEYIITEDLLCRVERALKYSGKNELATEFGAIRNCFIPAQDSHSASDVLDELEKEMSERIEHLKKMNKTETQLACWGECQSWWVRMQELRSQQTKEHP